jgi:hypothetical protein
VVAVSLSLAGADLAEPIGAVGSESAGAVSERSADVATESLDPEHDAMTTPAKPHMINPHQRGPLTTTPLPSRTD